MRFTSLLVLLVLVSGCIDSEKTAGPASTKRPEQTTTTITPSTTIIASTTTSPAQTASTSVTATSVTTTSTASTSTTTKPKTVDIKPRTLSNCIGFVPGAPEEMPWIADLGAGWARPHPGPFAWEWVEKRRGESDYAVTDEWVRAAQESGVALLGTIWPYVGWDQGRCHKAECEVSETDIFYPRGKGGFTDGIPKSRCIPCGIEDYKKFVGRLVERYDGDGVDDMPGLTQPVKFWETLNEPAMRSEDLTFFKGTAQEYVQILKATYESVKKACPDCTVVQGGAEGTDPKFTAYWEEVFENGGGQYFDIANIHYISSGDLSTLNVAAYKRLLAKHGIDKPVWVTEAEYKSENEIDASTTGALKAGAAKIFYTRFKAGGRGPPQPGAYSQQYRQQPGKCPSN